MSDISSLNQPEKGNEDKKTENPTIPSPSETTDIGVAPVSNESVTSTTTPSETPKEDKQTENPTPQDTNPSSDTPYVSTMEPTSSPVSEDKETENPTKDAETAPASGPATPTPNTSDEPSTESSKTTPSTTETSFLDLMLSKIEPIETQKVNFKMMIYSDPGVGKTDLLGQIPNHLIVDSEEGTESIMYSERRGSNVQRMPFKTFKGLEMVVEEFHKSPEQLSKFKNISIDTVSNLHKRGLAEVLRREHDKAPSINSAFLAETEHHTENNERIRQLVQNMVTLERNVFLTVHRRTLEPKNQDARTFPDFSEKLANTLAGMMDVVAYMYIANIEGEQHRVMKFQPSAGIVAKSRGRGKDLPDNMIDPTWEKINEVLKLEM